MKIRTIISLSKLLNALRTDLKGSEGEPVWFRGHSKQNWKLLPAFQRLNKPTSEINLINKFRQNANLLLDSNPKSDFDWLFVMQHYGVPTRLLDWTESPLVGLFFAVSDHRNKHGILWVLKPIELNKKTTAKPDEVKYIPSFEDEATKIYSTIAVEKGNLSGILPIAVIATRNNPRIQAQLGVFTVSHSTKKPIEDIGNMKHVIKYIIPNTAKSKILDDLQLLGFTKFQVFPELSSIGDNIRKALS
jgi:FRG domain